MSYQVPVLTPTNYPVWAVKIKSIMDAHGIWETVEAKALGEESNSKKKKQALAFLFQAIPEDMVLQMASYTDPKQVWDGLKTWYLGVRGSGENGSTSNSKEGTRRLAYEGG